MIVDTRIHQAIYALKLLDSNFEPSEELKHTNKDKVIQKMWRVGSLGAGGPQQYGHSSYDYNS